MSLLILDLPSPSRFILSIGRSIGEGGCVASNLSPLGSLLALNIKELIEGWGEGWSVRVVQADLDDFEISLSTAFRCHQRPVGTIASDSALDGRVGIIEIPLHAHENNKEKILSDVKRFWQKRGELGPALIILYPFEWSIPVNTKMSHFSWADTGFQRIDSTIWALTNLIEHAEPLGIFAEALAVEAGEQDLNLVAKIASASKDDLEKPIDLLHRISPNMTDTIVNKYIWRAQVRAFLPWIEECRQLFVYEYSQYLSIDERQEMLRVKEIRDIEIGGIEYQLRDAGCLTPHQQDLIWALSHMRRAIAHGKVCESRHLSVALSKARRI